MFSTLSFFIGLSIIPKFLLAQDATNLTCFNSNQRGLDASDCRRALRYIVYDKNGCLDSLSKGVFVWHRTCVINIQKLRSLQPNRQWVEFTVQAITERCKSMGGIRNYRESITAQVYRSTGQNVYQINNPVCEKRECNYQANDCLIAMNKLPVDLKGNFIAPSKTRFSTQSEVTWGSCTASVRTTDSSAFRMSHVEANPAFKRLLNKCGSHPGNIYISGGTEGNNGDVMLSTRSFC